MDWNSIPGLNRKQAEMFVQGPGFKSCSIDSSILYNQFYLLEQGMGKAWQVHQILEYRNTWYVSCTKIIIPKKKWVSKISVKPLDSRRDIENEIK